jgi:acetoin utilization deacetylase AcuC-like enzyme
LTYARVRWGLDRVAVVDIDVHFGNGTAELLRNDPNAFFASVHMLYNDAGVDQDAKQSSEKKFYPEPLGATEYSDNYVSIGLKPDSYQIKAGDVNVLRGSQGYHTAINQIIERLERFQPQLLIISAGFDGYHADPIGGDLNLELDDYRWSTKKLVESMNRISDTGCGRVVSLLEGGYDTESDSMGLAKCANAHVFGLRDFEEIGS